MMIEEVRKHVADSVLVDNPAHVARIRNGGFDHGPDMRGGLAIWRVFMAGMQPAPEEIEA